MSSYSPLFFCRSIFCWLVDLLLVHIWVWQWERHMCGFQAYEVQKTVNLLLKCIEFKRLFQFALKIALNAIRIYVSITISIELINLLMTDGIFLSATFQSINEVKMPTKTYFFLYFDQMRNLLKHKKSDSVSMFGLRLSAQCVCSRAVRVIEF